MKKPPDGETLEWALDAQGNPDKTRMVPLYFLPKRLLNLAIPTVDAHLELQPLHEIGIKQNLADNLSAVAPQNWAAIENQVDAFLDELRNNPQSFTPARREALQRGIWAERAFLQAADFSDELLKNALESLGRFLADVVGEILKAESSVMKGAKKRVQTAEQIRASPEFKTGSLNNELAAAAGGADYSLVSNAELFGALSNAAKALNSVQFFIGIKLYLIEEMGVEPALAQKVVNILVSMVRGMFNALKDGGMNNFDRNLQGLIPLLQEAVKFTINEARPILFDSDPALGVSFATDVSPTLQKAVDLMKNWNTSDEAGFLSDRRTFLERLDEYISFQQNVLSTTYAAQAAGEGFSNVEAGAAVIGTAFKWVKVVEKVSKGLKYFGNFQGFYIPLIAVYSATPYQLEALTRLIYHQPAPLNAQSVLITSPPAETAQVQAVVAPLTQTAEGQTLVTPVPSNSPVRSSIAGLRTTLVGNDIGAAVQTAVAPQSGASLAVAYAKWKRDYQRFEAAATALAAVATNNALGYELNILQRLRSDLRTEEARVGVGLGELFAGVLSGTFPEASSLSYLAARADALAALDRFDRALVGISVQVAAVSTGFSRAGGAPPLPALVLEPGSIISGGTVVRTITQDSQSFSVRMTAYNAGGSALPALRVELNTWGLGNGVTVNTPVKTLPPLQPGTEATLEWTFTCNGAANGGAVALTADLAALETAPTNLFVLAAEWILPVDPILADKDLDGLPDSYETSRGLNPALDDASQDRDNDGLTNLQEFELGTDPRIADTDGDGLSDTAEVSGAIKSERTDPLIADSDDDGAHDGADGAPLDPNSKTTTARPALSVLAVDSAVVILTPESPSAAIPVANTGGGYLLLQAESENPGLFAAFPAEPILTTGGTVRLTAPHPFPALGGQSLLRSTVTIRNLASGLPQFEQIQVILSLSDGIINIRQDGINVVICWPKTTSNYFLEQTSSIGPAKQWSSVSTAAQEAGAQLCITVPVEGTTRFYRLRKQ